MVSTPWIFANLLGLIIGVWLFAHYCLERKAINSFARKSIEGARDPTEEVLALSGIVYSMMNAYPHHQEDPHFVPLRWFFALGASPGAVLQKGGSCSGRTRLNIVCLHCLGYKAWQITLDSGTGQHCLLEVSIAGRKFLIDPTYGFYYVDELGSPLGLSSLRAGQCPSFLSLPQSMAHGYPQHIYYNFDYRNAKTVNWVMSQTRRALYCALFSITLGRIDTLRQPPVLEWPQLILLSAIATVLLILNVTLLLML